MILRDDLKDANDQNPSRDDRDWQKWMDILEEMRKEDREHSWSCPKHGPHKSYDCPICHHNPGGD